MTRRYRAHSTADLTAVDIRLGTCVQLTERVAEQGILFAQARVRGIGRIPQPDEVAGLADGERMADSLADLMGEGGGGMQRLPGGRAASRSRR